MKISVSSLVIVKGDAQAIIYVVAQLTSDKAYIEGLHYLIRKVVLNDEIILATEEQIENERKKAASYFSSVTSIRRRNRNYLLGTILHIDGDKRYLKKCLELYKTVGIFSNGIMI